MEITPVLFVAFLGGFVPALLWLIFWLLEDRCEPEPKRIIFASFFAGMVAVILVLPIEKLANDYFTGIALLFAWAAAEELLKFGGAWLVALRSRALDEPIDAIIYMVTAALGFSALENMLFLIGPLSSGDSLGSLITGNLRFIGATLLHVLASATVGIAIALSFYKDKKTKQRYLLSGVILAVMLHGLFNFFILQRDGETIFSVFLGVWIGVIAVLLLVERVKRPARDYC